MKEGLKDIEYSIYTNVRKIWFLIVESDLKKTKYHGTKSLEPKFKATYRNKFTQQRQDSLQVHGPRLWNSLPASIRNISQISKETFKKYLDVFLQYVPDTPTLNGLTPRPIDPLTAQSSNSILHWLPLMKNETHLKPPYNRSIFEKLLMETDLEKSELLLAELCLQDRVSSPAANVKVTTQTAGPQGA